MLLVRININRIGEKLRPDATLTRKLMHELKINLLVSLSELEGGGTKGT